MNAASILIEDAGIRAALERLGRAAHSLALTRPQNAYEELLDGALPTTPETISDKEAFTTGLSLIAVDILSSLPSVLSIAKIDQLTATYNLSTAGRLAKQ